MRNLEERTLTKDAQTRTQKPIARTRRLRRQEKAQTYCDMMYRIMDGPSSGYSIRFWGS